MSIVTNRENPLTLKMRNIEYETDISYLQEFTASHDTPLHIIATEFTPSSDKKASPCFLCSWYRRKALFHFAQHQGFNKIALGHHQDDIINTALMNLMFHGNYSSMPPSMKMEKMPITLIRPLCLEQEQDIILHAQHMHYKKQTKLCPYENQSKRSVADTLFHQIEAINKEARFHLWHALHFDD